MSGARSDRSSRRALLAAGPLLLAAAGLAPAGGQAGEQTREQAGRQTGEQLRSGGPFEDLSADPAWLRAEPGFDWSFPADHWSHPGYKSEWWYLTGHLQSVDDPERRFGYQFTFFRVGLLPAPPEADSAWATGDLIMGHAALGDFSGGTHRFSELLYRAVPLLGGFNRSPVSAIAWSRGPAGTVAPWTLYWNGTGFDMAMRDEEKGMAFALSTRPVKPLTLHGDGGYSAKGKRPGSGASLYYSFTRLRTEGTVTLDGETFRVQGDSWMDKEIGSDALRDDQVGWDWFGLQLTDGRELMLYLLRDESGRTDHASGTLIGKRGDSRALDASGFSVEVTGRWTSAATGGTYPSGWTVTVPAAGLRLRLEPEMKDQENRAQRIGGLFYWEGAVSIRDDEGAELGHGYVELTGYGTRNRPAL